MPTALSPAVTSAAQVMPAHAVISAPVHQNKPQPETLTAEEQAALDCV